MTARAWNGEGRDVGLYQAHALARIVLPRSRPHPSPLVESGPMASVPPPAPTYRPVLPPAVQEEGRISDAQIETVIYAGEAHAGLLPGRWRTGQTPHELVLARDDDEGAVQFRRGFFLGDGTGCGKGRQIAAVIADNMAQGRVKAVWLSRNDALLEDARRDWCAIGGGAHDIVPLSSWKQGEAIRLDRGVLFATYATLRQPARGDRRARLDQIVDWLGEDFDGVIAFDEAHAMANAAGGGKGARGTRKASLQGMAGLGRRSGVPACAWKAPLSPGRLARMGGGPGHRTADFGSGQEAEKRMTIGRTWTADQCRKSLANQRVCRTWALAQKKRQFARSGRSGSDAAAAAMFWTERFNPHPNEASS